MSYQEEPDAQFNQELLKVAERMIVHIIGEHNNSAVTTDFEHALFGPEFVDPSLFNPSGLLILNASIFGAALRSLIAAKKVVADREIDGTWYYRNVDKSGRSEKHG